MLDNINMNEMGIISAFMCKVRCLECNLFRYWSFFFFFLITSNKFYFETLYVWRFSKFLAWILRYLLQNTYAYSLLFMSIHKDWIWSSKDMISFLLTGKKNARKYPYIGIGCCIKTKIFSDTQLLYAQRQIYFSVK